MFYFEVKDYNFLKIMEYFMSYMGSVFVFVLLCITLVSTLVLLCFVVSFLVLQSS